MITVKLSYSILNAWASGKWEDAVGYYLGKEIPATPAMELGKLKDQIWEKYINTTKTMPDELGGELLVNPVTQRKYQKYIPLSDDIRILIRGVPDCLDGNIIYEFKCGSTEAINYIEKMQTDYYKLLLPDATIAIYKCFNPYTGFRTEGIKYLHYSNAQNALEHIITYGSEMIDYLRTQKLLINYEEK